MFCKKCGNELNNDAIFCPNCGEKAVFEFKNEYVAKKNNKSKAFKISKILFFVDLSFFVIGFLLAVVTISPALKKTKFGAIDGLIEYNVELDKDIDQALLLKIDNVDLENKKLDYAIASLFDYTDNCHLSFNYELSSIKIFVDDSTYNFDAKELDLPSGNHSVRIVITGNTDISTYKEYYAVEIDKTLKNNKTIKSDSNLKIISSEFGSKKLYFITSKDTPKYVTRTASNIIINVSGVFFTIWFLGFGPTFVLYIVYKRRDNQ